MLRGQRIVSWTTQHGVGALRRFAGEPEHVVNYFALVAEEVPNHFAPQNEKVNTH